jgi:hypothetical protein
MAKAHTLRDTFDDNAINATVWSCSTHAQEVGGRLEIRPIPDETTWEAYTTNDLYDLTDSSITVEVVQATNTYTFLDARYDYDNNTKIAMWLSYGMMDTPSHYTPYDPVAHRWWRIRERAGTTYFEVSPNGYDWTVLDSVPTPIPVNGVQVVLGAGAQTPSPDPGVAIFDNLNMPPGVPVAIPDRSCQAFRIRVRAATLADDRGTVPHSNNGEELAYPYIANYSKGLQHDANGDVVPASYQSLLNALSSREPAAFEAILLGPGGK